MPSTLFSRSNKITISGPFWSAKARILAGSFGSNSTTADIMHTRNIFVEDIARAEFGYEQVHLPGTIVALCFVEDVKIHPNEQNSPNYQWRRAQGESASQIDTLEQMKELLYEQQGQITLLLLETNPEQLTNKVFTCLAGEINLGVLQPRNNALQRLYQALDLEQIQGTMAALRWSVSVHSSGLSIFGKARLPWEQNRIAAPFQLTRIWPDPPATAEDSPHTGFRLSIETDRLTDNERNNWLRVWRNLSLYLSPKNPLTGQPVSSVATPHWVTLEITNPLALPRLFWQISPWPEKPESLPLHFERGEFNLLLTDQQPHHPNIHLTSLAQFVPDIRISGDATDGLEISVEIGPVSTANDKTMDYQWGKESNEADSVLQEHFAFSGMEVAFNPVETPEFLRDHQNLPIPEWLPGKDPKPVEPAIVWGFMPLEDGWVQLPVPNLTEQIYLNAELSNFEDQTGGDTSSMLLGAVSLGNEAVLSMHRDEQPWNVTLINAQRAQGIWKLKADDTNGFVLEDIVLNIFRPDIILNGLFWFSTGRPTPEDALPDLDDWISGLQSIPLTTFSETELFPPAIKFILESFTVSLRNPPPAENNEPVEVPSALLTTWSFTYAANESLLQKMVETRVLPESVFSQFLPLVWRRHAFLPMIQALPLTQSKSPPDYPNASRQLVPFELSVSENGDGAIPLPDNWSFRVSGTNGAVQWPRLLITPPSANEWASMADLPLVALSLPGLVLDPNISTDETGLATDDDLHLPMQYRFDTPYTDQPNALSQLPKTPRNPEEVSPLPDSPPPEPPEPLTRDTFKEYWQSLSNRASLASVDATEAFISQGQNDQTFIFVQHLIEPFVWPVRPTLSLTEYPGAMTIENQNNDNQTSITLESLSALQGISGRFDKNGVELKRLSDDDSNGNASFLIEAGSMAAYWDQTDDMYRDQRGLLRARTKRTKRIKTTETDWLLITPVKLHKTLDLTETYQLTSALTPVPLQISNDTIWQFWFRDLPVENNNMAFVREKIRSEKAEDVNDPEALSREFNFRNGYEWRLGITAQPDTFLPMYGLHFYPLTLKAVNFEVDPGDSTESIESIEIVGRLQLPLPDLVELDTFSNAVCLTFKQDGNNHLKLDSVDLEVLAGEWPLALSGGEAVDAPRLEWRRIRFDNRQNQIEIDDVLLKFFLFDVTWSLQLSPIIFSGDSGENITQKYRFDVKNVPFYPKEVMLEIDLTSFMHHVSLIMGIQLGNRVVDDKGIVAQYDFVQGEDPAVIYDVSDIGPALNLAIPDPAAVEWLSNGGLAVINPTLIASDGPATIITEAIKNSNEITVEAWVKPANTTQDGPARIVSISADTGHRNFTLGQGRWGDQPSDVYDVRLRTSVTNQNGIPSITSPAGTVTTDLTHVVYTRAAEGIARLYIDGVEVVSEKVEGDLNNWNEDYRLLLANETTQNRTWLGEYHQISIYNCVLSPDTISDHFNKGGGARLIRPAFHGEVRFTLAGNIETEEESPANRVAWESAFLFDDLVLGATDRSVLYTENALQFNWKKHSAGVTSNLHLLPGMNVSSKEAPGFAVVTFAVLSVFTLEATFEADLNSPAPSANLRQAFEENGFPLVDTATILIIEAGSQWQIQTGEQSYAIRKTDGKLNIQTAIPQFELRSSFLEVLIACQWGQFLQDEESEPLRTQVFGSSGGDLMFGYTARWQDQTDTWDESFLLNGFVEVKNLISWPVDLLTNENGTLLTLPPVNADQPEAMHHMRHTIRILLNQHQIPSDLLVVGTGRSIFNLAGGKPWQFLAVVEHQLIDVSIGSNFASINVLNDRRWTTLQEVRILHPNTFNKFLNLYNQSEFLAEKGIANYGYWRSEIQSRLRSEWKKLPSDTLLVEASAPHWIRQDPVTVAGETTLQFLPSGSQLGILSNPQDYKPSSPNAPKWLLLTMPFLGRLQRLEYDGQLTNSEALAINEISPLQVDPVLYLYHQSLQPAGGLSDIALVFANWSGKQANDNLVVRYDFVQGEDPAVVYDVSGIGPPLNLTINDPTAIEWLPDGGLAVINPTLIGSDEPASKIIEAIKGSNEITVEAWIKPANTTQAGPARIVSISANTSKRNFTLGQGKGSNQPSTVYDVRLRTSKTNQNGIPSITSPAGTVTIDLTHVVYTRAAEGTARLYIDGVEVVSEKVEGDLNNWDEGYRLLLANETTQNRTWLGEYHQASIYNCVLSPDIISDHFDRGSTQTDKSVPLDMNISFFDGYVGRSWPRLDPISLEENWFRLQNPLPEPHPAGLQSIMAELPDTPARLSRSAALRRAFNTFRRFYPPKVELDHLVENEVQLADHKIVWHQDRLLVIQGAQHTHGIDSDPPYSWHLTGLLLRGSNLAERSSNLRRYPAATLIPALLDVNGQENKIPVSFAVSPYLGLGFRKPGERRIPELVSLELLCLEPASGELLPVASRFMVFKKPSKEAKVDPETQLREESLIWARETHLRLAPESQVAVLRFRQINSADTEGLLTVSYAFAAVPNLHTRKKLSKHVFRMRTEVDNLRFREGQFGGNKMPDRILTFELAPPQTTGVQPLYLAEAPNTGDENQKLWPWGLSALRMSVEYAQNNEGVVGKIAGGETSGETSVDMFRLWWQSPQHSVQYRSALNSRQPAAGLPKLFRASAIKSLLPVLPNPPMPSVNAEEYFSSAQASIDSWQPVLPGRLRYLLVGARSGVMFAIRNQLLRQSSFGSNGHIPDTEAVLVSGSVPVQHRMPRPVPIPSNTNTEHALQTWASYFEPEQNLLVTTSPADEAFMAACGKQPPKRLRMILHTPENGVIPLTWNGDLIFKIDSHERLLDMNRWDIIISLINGNTKLGYNSPASRVAIFSLDWETVKVEFDSNTNEIPDKLRAAFEEQGIELAEDAKLSFDEQASAFTAYLASYNRTYLLEKDGLELKIYHNLFKYELKSAINLNETPLIGDNLLILAKIQPTGTVGDFGQTLSFPLRLASDTLYPLPLEPQFIHFEDPEYNRRLASSSAHKSKNITVTVNDQPRLQTITISADRKAYNPDSEIALRYDYDWEELFKKAAPSLGSGTVILQRLSLNGTLTSLHSEQISPGQLKQFQLSDYKDNEEKPILKAGDKLQIRIEIGENTTIHGNGQALNIEIQSTFAVLPIDIIDNPVTPVPEAGYALLHSQIVEGQQEVECARFAWNPAPARIELVCPDDLTTEVVRRRAVFHWRHSVRPGRTSRFGIQKITQSGSTHFPHLDSSP